MKLSRALAVAFFVLALFIITGSGIESVAPQPIRRV
jgi:hypothetical protein